MAPQGYWGSGSGQMFGPASHTIIYVYLLRAAPRPLGGCWLVADTYGPLSEPAHKPSGVSRLCRDREVFVSVLLIQWTQSLPSPYPP